ncbi:MAG: hypothetical protein Terrestrivirus5_33 [Terrestrivirus sp.]|uniref:Uncharacterized protein n=1 Tax=Terrestrivirus sp. TaxID=2487775 RepID=A0A3G4ZQE3_9VIRU|nr:MAG: hypothetical protein Terrestrivirus5_33 [Terrestrivirus sp.]
MNLIHWVIVFLLISSLNGSSEALSCDIIDHPAFGRISCIASCQIQNCATGKCSGPNNLTCVCSRCANGKPSYP